MPAPAFPTGNKAPSADALVRRVGAPWNAVQQALDSLPKAIATWRFSSASGWHLTYDLGARRLFYAFPQNGDLLLKLVFNARGVDALSKSGKVCDKLRRAKRYAEGTVLEFQASELQAALLADLLRIKAASMR